MYTFGKVDFQGILKMEFSSAPCVMCVAYYLKWLLKAENRNWKIPSYFTGTITYFCWNDDQEHFSTVKFKLPQPFLLLAPEIEQTYLLIAAPTGNYTLKQSTVSAP